jgi:DNA-binding MarR family transcriptional regulator
MLRTNAALMRRIGADLERDHAMAMSEYEMLGALSEAPGRRLTMGAIAEAVGLTPSGTTRLVDRAEQRGWVRREPDAVDGRRSQAVITTEGLAACRAAGRTYQRGVRTLFADRLDDRDVTALVKLWGRLAAD